MTPHRALAQPKPTVSMSGASRQGCQAGVGGGVVTHNPTDPVCPQNELSDVAAGAGSASWCRPDQKPVRPGGVTRHSVVAAGPFRCAAHDTDKGDASCWQTSWIM